MFQRIILLLFVFLILFNFFIKEKYNSLFSLSSIFSLIIVFGIVSIFFQKKKIVDLFTLSVSSIYITIFILNIFIKTFYFDTQVELIKKYQSNEVNLRPAVFPSLFYESELQILSGLSNQETIYCKEDNFFTVYKSDRYGFNNDDDVYEKNNKFILLGDSFTHGACVKEGEDIAGLLRKKNINAVNLGMGGNSEISKLATFKEYGVYLKPKYVLWMYTNGDLVGTMKELENKNINKYFYENNYSQNLINRNSEKDKFIDNYLKPLEKKENLDYLMGHFTFYDLRKFLKNFIFPRIVLFDLNFDKNKDVKTSEVQKFDILDRYKNFYKEENLEIFSSILSKVKNTCDNNNCEVYFVFMPSNKDLLKQKKRFIFKDLLLEEVKKLNIKVIDTEEEFLKVDIRNYMISHYNANGYEIVANEIAKKINN